MILKKKLDEKGIEYEINDSVEKMLALGIFEVPYLDIGSGLLDYREALVWADRQAGRENK